MRAIVFAMTVLAATQAGGHTPDRSLSDEAAKEGWRQANRLCWSGRDFDGTLISETAMKVACISAGVLTARLVDAGYCLDARESEWKPC